MTTDIMAELEHLGPEEHEAPVPDHLQTVPVRVVDDQGALRVHQAAYDGATGKTKTLGTTAVQILTADHHRARVLLFGQAAFLVAFNGEVDTTQDTASMAYWPANTPLELRANTAVWAAAATGTCALSIITERTTVRQPGGVR